MAFASSLVKCFKSFYVGRHIPNVFEVDRYLDGWVGSVRALSRRFYHIQESFDGPVAAKFIVWLVPDLYGIDAVWMQSGSNPCLPSVCKRVKIDWQNVALA